MKIPSIISVLLTVLAMLFLVPSGSKADLIAGTWIQIGCWIKMPLSDPIRMIMDTNELRRLVWVVEPPGTLETANASFTANTISFDWRRGHFRIDRNTGKLALTLKDGHSTGEHIYSTGSCEKLSKKKKF